MWIIFLTHLQPNHGKMHLNQGKPMLCKAGIFRRNRFRNFMIKKRIHGRSIIWPMILPIKQYLRE
jgi:hypothetical protein